MRLLEGVQQLQHMGGHEGSFPPPPPPLPSFPCLVSSFKERLVSSIKERLVSSFKERLGKGGLCEAHKTQTLQSS
jgi:hypothetical protein